MHTHISMIMCDGFAHTLKFHTHTRFVILCIQQLGDIYLILILLHIHIFLLHVVGKYLKFNYIQVKIKFERGHN